MSAGEILLYQTEDGRSRIDVRLVNDTIWLSAGQMADLFQRDKSVILKHIKNVFAEPRLQLRHMPKRWGSAGTDGKIALNPELIHAPAPCIDYVITHEICHLRHPAHDRAFFRQLAILLPNWRELKARLERAEVS